MSVMNSFMQANDKIDGVFAINDAMAEGAPATESANRLDGMVMLKTVRRTLGDD